MTALPAVTDAELPGLYQSANRASMGAQRAYLAALISYLSLLIVATFVASYSGNSPFGALLSALLFLASLAILVGLRAKRPDDIWYNGRAVAESVKTRTWRWMMKAEPYVDTVQLETVSKSFIDDLKQILSQNRSLAAEMFHEAYLEDAITQQMKAIRGLSVEDRLAIYKRDRVEEQAGWYAREAAFNKKRATRWFWVSVLLHSLAVLMLLLKVQDPSRALPIEVVATAASGILTWLQAKKHNELASSYSLTAHEIVLIKGEALSVIADGDLSDFVVNAEAAFSREHTQWAARKND